MSFKYVAIFLSLAVCNLACDQKIENLENPPSENHIKFCKPPQAIPNLTELSVMSSVKYGEDPRHELDIYLPSQTNYPVVMFIHGGSWENGNKDIYSSLGHLFVKKGIGCVVINYRLSPQVKHPSHIEDVAKAFAWVNNNISRYGGDSERIYVMGHSAGAHLAALLATNDQYLLSHNLCKTRIKGVVVVSGMYNFNSLVLRWAGLNYIFPTEVDRAAASPIRHIKPDSPSFLVLYAQKDLTTFEGQAKNFHETLQKTGCKSSLLMVSNKDHFTILFDICDQQSKSSKTVIGYIK